jgi:hypothetical protein
MLIWCELELASANTRRKSSQKLNESIEGKKGICTVIRIEAGVYAWSGLLDSSLCVGNILNGEK